ncbi:MAG TPA: hypothetical protein VJ180_05525, partial [Pyrinomonadaceae bacterium]|nr:hypothetical protein [Pyrinomonadaceae bacterium]
MIKTTLRLTKSIAFPLLFSLSLFSVSLIPEIVGVATQAAQHPFAGLRGRSRSLADKREGKRANGPSAAGPRNAAADSFLRNGAADVFSRRTAADILLSRSQASLRAHSFSSGDFGVKALFERNVVTDLYRSALTAQPVGVTNAALTGLDQTITIDTEAPASAAYNTNFTVAASASSSLPITYSSAGSCTNEGPVFTMTSGSGTC